KHISAPIIFFVQATLEVADRAAIEVELASARERETQARRPVLTLVDAVAAEHEEVDADRKTRQLDQEMLSPRAQGDDARTDQARLVDLRIAFRSQNALPGERLRQLAQDN